MWPANRAMPTDGITSIRPMIPSERGSLVSEYTSHSIRMNCMVQASTIINRTPRKMLNSR